MTKNTRPFDEENSFNKMLDYLLKIKGEEERFGNEIIDYGLQLHIHNGSEFVLWIIVKNLPGYLMLVDMIINGKVKFV